MVDIIQNSYRALSNRINADADEEVCSCEEQERLADMSCHEGITNETKETHIGSKRMRQIQEKKQKE